MCASTTFDISLPQADRGAAEVIGNVIARSPIHRSPPASARAKREDDE